MPSTRRRRPSATLTAATFANGWRCVPACCRRSGVPPTSYDYAVIRVVPRVDRGEFINAGIVLASARQGFLQAALALDETRLRALDPTADVAAIGAALAIFPLV